MINTLIIISLFRLKWKNELLALSTKIISFFNFFTRKSKTNTPKRNYQNYTNHWNWHSK